MKLEIELEDLQELYKNADATTKQNLEAKFKGVALNQDITDIIIDYPSACTYLSRKELDLADFEFLPPSQRVNAFYRHKIITVIEGLAGDFVPDYSDYNQYKYTVYAYHDNNGLGLYGGDTDSVCDAGADFALPTAKLRDHLMLICKNELLEVLTVKTPLVS